MMLVEPATAEKAVRLVVGPGDLRAAMPSDWPMLVGIVLVVLGVVLVAGWWGWMRVDAERAAGWLLRLRFCRSVREWRAAKQVAEGAGVPVAGVLISQTAYARGARVAIECKGAGVSPAAVATLGRRVFGEGNG